MPSFHSSISYFLAQLDPNQLAPYFAPTQIFLIMLASTFQFPFSILSHLLLGVPPALHGMPVLSRSITSIT